MSKLNVWRTSPPLRLGLAVTLGLTFLIGLLLVMSTIHPPDVAQAQVFATNETLTNIVQVTNKKGVTSFYTETFIIDPKNWTTS